MSRTWKWLCWSILTLGALGMMAPFAVMVFTSLMTQDQVFRYPPVLWPSPPTLENYQTVFQQIPLGRYLFNSALVAGITTLGQVLLSAMAAYGFARFSFPYKTPLFWVFLATMMIPPQVNIVPLFFVMKTFHWVDTYMGLIVPGLFGAFGVFLLRQWFLALPKDLEDAASMDGCNPWTTFWHIALPLVRPALVALGMFAFIASWNSFMWPLIITQSDALRTLPVGIAALKSTYRDVTAWQVLMAAATLSVIPVIAIFLLGQRQFIQGLLQGGVKE